MRNSRIGANKLVGYVSINLLHHSKSATCVISIISNALEVVHVNNFVTAAALLCQCVIVNKQV